MENFNISVRDTGPKVLEVITPGPRGQTGKSAFDYAVEQGFVGTIEEWDPLESTCRHASLSIL